MPRTRAWSRLDAELRSHGYDLATGGLLGPWSSSELHAEDDAWEDWDRLAPSLGDAEASVATTAWPLVAPHLAEIEAAVAKRADRRIEACAVFHAPGIRAAKAAVRGLASGATETERADEGLDRLRLAALVARQLATGPRLLSVLLAVNGFRSIFDAAGRLLTRPLSSDQNAALREVVAPLQLSPWREVVYGELRYGLGWIDRTATGGEAMERDLGLDTVDRRFAALRTLAHDFSRRDASAQRRRERAKGQIAAMYAEALLAPRRGDDFENFDRIAPTFEPSPFARFSPDRWTRTTARLSNRAWSVAPRLYRGLTGYRRMIGLASLAADLPPGSQFADVERLRLDLGEEGWDPFLRNPVRVVDEGDAWAFYANAVKEIAVVRIPRK